MSDDFDALLDAALEHKPAEPSTSTVTVPVGDGTVTLRFTEMDPREWHRCTMAHPGRPDVALEVMFGYNLVDTAKHAAPLSGVRVVDDVEHKLTAKQWGKFFTAIDREGWALITDAIFGLNEAGPLARLEAVKKALVAAPKKKRPSPAS